MGRNDNANSTIGQGSVFEGNFYISGSLHIDGKFTGSIKTENQLSIGETGKVKTDITARTVIVGGTLIGNVKATEEVRLQETGRMLGDISAPHIIFEKGVVASGKINITGGQKKDIKKIVEESFNSGPALPGSGSGSTPAPVKK